MATDTTSHADEGLTFRIIYEYLGRRVYLILLFIFAVLLLLLLLWWRQQAQVLQTNYQIQQTDAQLKSYVSSRPTTAPVVSVSDESAPQPVSVIRLATQTREIVTTTTPPLVSEVFVRPADHPSTGDIAGSYVQGFVIEPDAVELGADTSGDYIQNIIAGSGLSGDTSGEGATATLTIQSGDGIAVGADGVSVQLQTGGGLTFVSGSLSLLTSCSDGQLLKWTVASQTWGCANDLTGASALQARETDGSPNISAVTALEFGPSTNSSNEFILSDQGGGVARLRTGTAVPLTNAAASISGTWSFTSEIAANGGLSCADCVTLGTETSGNYLAGLLAGSGLSVTGSGTEGATPTVGLDSAIAVFKTIDASLGTDPVADSLTDTLSLTSGSGIDVTGDSTADSVSFSVRLNAGGGLSIVGGGISLLNTCADGQYLQWSSGSWVCASWLTPNLFQTMNADSGAATADSASDSLTIIGGNGIITTAADAPDSVTLNIDLASGSGMIFSGGALSLASCTDGQILKRLAGAWTCAGDTTLSAGAYQQQLAGTDDRTVGSSLTPMLTNGSGVAQSLPITITSGSKVSFIATLEVASSLATGPVNYVVIRDDNGDNDCGTGGGDGVQVGGQVTSFVATVAQTFTTTFSFADAAPSSTTVRYQLCASTAIALGTATINDRSLKLEEVFF